MGGWGKKDLWIGGQKFGLSDPLSIFFWGKGDIWIGLSDPLSSVWLQMRVPRSILMLPVVYLFLHGVVVPSGFGFQFSL